MNIQITDKYRITSDEHNFMLERRVDTKDGTEKWRTVGFYTKLDSALSSVRECLLRDSNVSSVPALLERAKEIDRMIDTLQHPKSTHGFQNAGD